MFYGEILKIITFYHFNTNPNFPSFSLCTGNILGNAFPVMNGLKNLVHKNIDMFRHLCCLKKRPWDSHSKTIIFRNNKICAF